MTTETTIHAGQYLIVSGATYQHREELSRRGYQWDGSSKTWSRLLPKDTAVVHGRYTGCRMSHSSDRRTVGHTIYDSRPGAGLVSTTSGALIHSAHSQADRAAMQRSGIDTDCDDHDLI